MPTPLSDSEIDKALGLLPGWSRVGDKLHREYRCADFREALGFLVRIGLEAEVRNHHPELYNVYANVTIDLCTHEAGDTITQKDVGLARAIENIAPTSTPAGPGCVPRTPLPH